MSEVDQIDLLDDTEYNSLIDDKTISESEKAKIISEWSANENCYYTVLSITNFDFLKTSQLGATEKGKAGQSWELKEPIKLKSDKVETWQKSDKV